MKRADYAGELAALPDFGLAAFALITWIRPSVFGLHWIRWFVLLMLVEFIVVHSSAFLGTIAFSRESAVRRIKGTILVSLFYTVFLVGFALGFKTWWPIVTFWLLSANRLAGVLLGQAPSGAEQELIKRGWAAGAVFYILGVMVTILLPLPRLGINPHVVAQLDLPGSGEWISHPHRAVAFAFVYFLAVALSERKGHQWARDRSR